MKFIAAFCVLVSFAAAQVPGPVLGELVISELMPNPASFFDELSEYFEVTNIGTHTVELLGCSFSDITTAAVVSVTVGISIQLAPGQACAFVRDPVVAAAIVPSGLVLSYVGCGAPACTTVGNLLLGNSATGDGIIFRDSLGQMLDVAGYGTLTTSPYAVQAAAAALPAPSSTYNGTSYERRDLRAAWFLPGNVGPSTNLIPSVTDHGSPGTLNSVDTTVAFLRNVTPPTIGTSVGIQILAARSANNARVLAGSFGNSGFQIGTLTIALDLDALFWMTLDPNNGVFIDYGINVCGPFGESNATMLLPPLPILSGLPIHHHAVLLDAGGNAVAVTSPLQTILIL
ncbi:MAG: lamin tail domain-containing protein [Planctomycetes bacterium]|nr:lamin tail domain-containing protein [Planctomycetota bacterium]